MIQELQVIMNMLAVDVMPEIVDFIETASLGDEVSNFLELIKCVKVVHRVLKIGKRVSSRISAKKRSEQCRDEDY